jgi:hypothetical protein
MIESSISLLDVPPEPTPVAKPPSVPPNIRSSPHAGEPRGCLFVNFSALSCLQFYLGFSISVLVL